MAVGVDRLAEVAVAVEQADADERDGHVGGRLEMVAGEHAQAARVDAERLVQAVLGAEVGDRAVELRAVLAVEPVAGAVLHVAVEVVEQRAVLGHQVDVVEDLRPVALELQQRHRVAVAQPRADVDAPEQDAHPRVPHPVVVVGQPRNSAPSRL